MQYGELCQQTGWYLNALLQQTYMLLHLTNLTGFWTTSPVVLCTTLLLCDTLLNCFPPRLMKIEAHSESRADGAQ